MVVAGFDESSFHTEGRPAGEDRDERAGTGSRGTAAIAEAQRLREAGRRRAASFAAGARRSREAPRAPDPPGLGGTASRGMEREGRPAQGRRTAGVRPETDASRPPRVGVKGICFALTRPVSRAGCAPRVGWAPRAPSQRARGRDGLVSSRSRLPARGSTFAERFGFLSSREELRSFSHCSSKVASADGKLGFPP